MVGYKIAFVLDDSLDSTDGVQQYVLNVGQWLASQGHRVHYIVGHTIRTDIPHIHSVSRNIKVRFNQNRMTVPLPTPMESLRTLLNKEKFDVIHVQVPYSPFMAARVMRAASKKTAVIGTFHIAPHDRIVHMANSALGFLLRKSLQRFDEMISVSPTAQNFAEQTFRIQSTIIPNTIDLTPFYSAKSLPEYAKNLTIMFFGRLVERKGPHLFLRAIYSLKQTGALPEHAKVLVCGKGPMSIELQEYVNQHGLEDVVEFTGFISEADKPRYLASADILVYPSTGGESFGIVLLEGMAAGRGVVLAGDNPGYRGVIGARPDALFTPQEETAFVAKLKEYVASPGLRAEAHEWQRNYVGQFDLPHVGKQIVGVYELALRKKLQ